MNWFVLALLTMLCWGGADLFYKKGTDEEDSMSHLKIAVWVGFIMGICSLILLFFTETDFSAASFAMAALKYTPASLAYIISMVIGYAGMRYLEASIISPIQNSSGALSVIAMGLYFFFTGRITDFGEEYSLFEIVGTIAVIIGVVALAIVEKKLEASTNRQLKVISVPALLFPLLYCLFDTIGTAADGIILDEQSGLGLGEIDVLVLYGLTFMLAGLVSWIFILIKTGKPYNPFIVAERPKLFAALCEEGGQIFYVYAMAQKPMLAAPMISAYCIVSVILLRIFIKEKLKKSQYTCVITVILGIILLGIAEGLDS